MSMGYGPEYQRVLRPRVAVEESDYPEPTANDGTIPLLREILSAIQETRIMQERPTLAQFNLSPDALQGPNNGRLLLPQSTRLRISQIVIFAVGVITFTLKVGESGEYFFPPLTAGNTPIALPVAIVLERGSTMQLAATAATWTGWALGFPE